MKMYKNNNFNNATIFSYIFLYLSEILHFLVVF